MMIQEAMTPNVDMVSPDTTLRDAAIRMRDGDVGSLPVVKDNQLLGMVTDRDVTVRGVADGKAPDKSAIHEVMSDGVFYCFEDQTPEDAAELMAEHKIRRLPVLSRDNRLVGVIAIADLVDVGAQQPAVEGISVPSSNERV